ncbi:putative ribonuclease H-like domain-containing protein [Tanacetum coccineum]
MSANDNFSLNDDEELSLHEDASLDGSLPASNKGDAPAKPPQIITTNTLSNIKLPVLQKDDYDTWAMEMEHYLEYIDNEVWKVIQNGNLIRCWETNAGKKMIFYYTADFKQVEYKGPLTSLEIIPLGTRTKIDSLYDDGSKELYQTIQSDDDPIPYLQVTGAGYSFERKPCFVCGSLSHLIKDCDYYEKKMAREAALKRKRVVYADVRQVPPAWNNTNRVNKANQVNVNTGHGNVNSGSVHVNAGTQVKSGASRFNTGKQNVNSGSMHVNSGTQIKSAASRFNTGKQHINSGCVHINTARVNRPVSNKTSPKPSQVNFNSQNKCFSKQSSPVNRPFSRKTAHESNKYAVKGKMGTAVKTSAGCVWRKITPLSNTNSGPTPDSNVNDHPLKHMEHRGIFDSGCSGHMTGNRAHLEDYQELSKVGSVTFGGSKGSISGKGTIRLGNLVFDDVAFVKELGHFNLFSISQICDKKLNVLFTEKECFVVSSDFKMPDENQVLLKVPRQHNMYTFDMKNVDSSKGYTCLLAKASSNEAKLWHRRLGHLNFKNLNKLVKDNLVRGLPSKSFKNDHTCVACQKGKQHKASCKAKIDRYVTHPLHTLHMDLFEA